nr:SH3 domain-containing protein [Ipomoea batatas]
MVITDRRPDRNSIARCDLYGGHGVAAAATVDDRPPPSGFFLSRRRPAATVALLGDGDSGKTNGGDGAGFPATGDERDVRWLWRLGVSAITLASSFSTPCTASDSSSVRIPLNVPSEVFCFPAELFRKSKMDLVVPPIFVVVVVATSAYVVKALTLSESAHQGERH